MALHYIMFTCPATQEATRSTQFPEATTAERFEEWLDEGVSSSEKCLACNGVHELSEEDYFLEGDAPPPS
jgi:hypothetical protein